ncbi:transglycosylase SLT domain-containing protein [Asticcacaulis sp. 201]|uniref:transglycosylase SLT domain-containing protein n=1 Tax=Asticcacaulis sp. 201 TaxID=3028787 RepID=UPI002916CA47|nr:transglycosylase SLT domain-containing protein [Asticcacaulis sp. 201]MDV6333035.1 transglycosylase SLT domain-containing protein [Asticcacaulis sp. 201]
MRTYIAPETQTNALNRTTDQVVRSVTGGARQAGSGVMGALQRAADATGVDFNYLVKTATRESSLNPNAKAPTSSAAGLFQFIEQTWLGMVKSHGAKHGYGSYADQISVGRDGRYRVDNPAARKQVLSLRYDPNASAVMGAELTAGHAAYLKGRIGRTPSQGELYVAHFLGAEGAADLIKASQTRPSAVAANLFPAAARANKSIFYNHGQALNVTDVVANLTKAGGSAPVTIRELDPIEDDGPKIGNPLIAARIDKVKADQAILSLVFGSDNAQQGTLFATQLLSAFGPEADEGGSKGRSNPYGQAFGDLSG